MSNNFDRKFRLQRQENATIWERSLRGKRQKLPGKPALSLLMLCHVIACFNDENFAE